MYTAYNIYVCCDWNGVDYIHNEITSEIVLIRLKYMENIKWYVLYIWVEFWKFEGKNLLRNLSKLGYRVWVIVWFSK